MDDKILHFADYQAEPGQLLYVPRHYGHGDYIAHYYRRYQGEELPEQPAGDLPNSVMAYVDKGRWV